MVTARALLVVAVAATLALAGCSGGPATTTNASNATTAGDGTPGASTTATTASGSPDALDGVDTPPWMRAGGVNATRLVDAHFGTLADASYRVETHQNATGFVSLEERGVGRVDANGTAIYRYETTTSDGTSVTDAFVNDTWVVTRTRNDSRTAVSDYRVGDGAHSLNYSRQLRQYVRLGDYAVNRTFEVDGETRIEYVATDPAPDTASGSYESFRGRLVVSPSGRVHALAVTATQTSQFGNATTRYSFRLADVGGVDASKPGWVSTVRQRAITVDLAYERDDGVLHVTHEGGDDVPAGTQVVVSPADAQNVYVARLPDAFSAGETLSLAPASDRRLALSFDGHPNATGRLTGTVQVAMYASDGEVVVRDDVAANATGSANATASRAPGARWHRQSVVAEYYPNQN